MTLTRRHSLNSHERAKGARTAWSSCCRHRAHAHAHAPRQRIEPAARAEGRRSAVAFPTRLSRHPLSHAPGRKVQLHLFVRVEGRHTKHRHAPDTRSEAGEAHEAASRTRGPRSHDVEASRRPLRSHLLHSAAGFQLHGHDAGDVLQESAYGHVRTGARRSNLPRTAVRG